MTQEQIASLIAGQTAALAAIVQLLIQKKLVDYTEVDELLHSLLTAHANAGASPEAAAAIKHLIASLENLNG